MTESEEKRPVVFFDRDGVLIRDKNYQINVDEIELFADTAEALKTLDLKFRKIIVSNQSGVGRGYFSAEDVGEFNKYLAGILAGHDIEIDGWYFCPHLPDDNCECRKPGIGMITQAAEEFEIDIKNSWLIGDKSTDIMAGRTAGAKTILLNTGYAGEDGGPSDVSPDYRADNLLMAVKLINRS
ncbi:MAG: HAD family hydrolase [candidate division Zixibacteria bacterium]